jgi:Ca-activated chloride channel homolog
MRHALLAGLLFWLVPAFLAQGPIKVQPRPKAAAPDRPSTNLRVDTNLVLVPVTVYDELNRPITGLEKKHFRLLDGKVEQVITHFASEDEPLAVCIAFDVSGSMGRALGASRMAAQRFFHVSNPTDEFCLVEFDSNPHLIIPLTRNLGELKNEIVFTKSGGQTALVDASVMAFAQLKKSKLTRKVLVIISDGGENNSRYTLREVRNIIRESDALVYAISIPGTDANPYFLRSMTEDSGGRVLPSDFGDAIEKVSIELRNRYLLGFTPSNEIRDGRYHSLRVQVVPPRGLRNLHADWRRGYYAPAD